MKKFLKITLTVLATLIVAILIIWNREIRTVAGIEQVGDDKYLYSCEYKAAYDLDEVVAAGIDENAKLVGFLIGKISKGLYKPERVENKKEQSFSCTTFQARNSDGSGYVFGRNYDYFKNPTLVLKSNPKNGYASISTCDLSHLGYSLEKLPDSFARKLLCLGAVYAPMDGMNEKGLCISIMALPKQAAWQDTGKPVVGTSIYMRLVLDRCATVREAIELTNSLDIRHDQKAGGGYHYLISDAQGNTAAIEFDLEDGWKTMITMKSDTTEYMHMTNHLLAPKYYTTEVNPKYGNPNSHSWERYAKVQEFMNARGGIVSLDEAQQCLSDVHWVDLVWPNGMIEDTQWSNVYDQTALTLRLRNWSSYATTNVWHIRE